MVGEKLEEKEEVPQMSRAFYQLLRKYETKNGKGERR